MAIMLPTAARQQESIGNVTRRRQAMRGRGEHVVTTKRGCSGGRAGDTRFCIRDQSFRVCLAMLATEGAR